MSAKTTLRPAVSLQKFNCMYRSIFHSDILRHSTRKFFCVAPCWLETRGEAAFDALHFHLMDWEKGRLKFNHKGDCKSLDERVEKVGEAPLGRQQQHSACNVLDLRRPSKMYQHIEV